MTHIIWLEKFSPPAAGAGNRLHNKVSAALIFCFRTVSDWRERAKQRRRLAELPDDRLRDIGVNRLEAIREAGKPFWQP